MAKIRMSRRGKISVITAAALIAIVSGTLAVKEGTTQKTKTVEEVSYSYENRASIDYSVTLKDNKVYEVKELGKDQYYIDRYVEDILLKFDDIFKASESTSVEGEYEVKLTFRAYKEEEKENQKEKRSVWEKNKVLVEKKSFNSDTLHEEITVHLNDYSAFVKNLIEKERLSIPTEVLVTMQGKKVVHTPKEDVELPIQSQVIIPVGEEVFEIETSVPDKVQKEQKETHIEYLPVNEAVVIEFGILSGISAILALLGGFLIHGLSAEKKQMKCANRVFSDYGNRMIEVEDLVLSDFARIYEVGSMEDLAKLAEELEKPMFYQKRENKAALRAVYLIDHTKLYRYRLPNASEDPEVKAETLKEQKRADKKQKKSEAKAAKKANKQAEKQVHKTTNTESSTVNASIYETHDHHSK